MTYQPDQTSNLQLDHEAGEQLRRGYLLSALEQIERLSREANGEMVDVRALLGDIARAAIARAANDRP